MVDFANPEESYSRRTMLGQLLSGLTLGRTHAEPPEPLISYFDGQGLGLSGGYLALEIFPPDHWAATGEERPEGLSLYLGYGWIGLRIAHRGEAIPAEAGPDPEPVSAELLGGVSRLGAVVARLWHEEDVPRCRRCERCNAVPSVSNPGLAGCLVRLDDYDGPALAATPVPDPEPAPSTHWAEQKFQRRLKAIRRRNALRDSRERRRARDMEPESAFVLETTAS